MAKAVSYLVLFCVCCFVKCVNPQTPAKVQQVEDGDDILQEPDYDEYVKVRSKNYAIQPSEGLEWLAAATAQRGFAVHGLSKQCLDELEEYWHGLDNDEAWAAKIYDATGRYSSQLLTGNDFWLGSMMLCNEIRAPHLNVTFRVAKLRLTLSNKISPYARVIYLGLCHPSLCSTNDSKLMLSTWLPPTRPSDNANSSTRIQVLYVRSVPGEFSVVKSGKFIILSVAIALVVILVAAATIYEQFLAKNTQKTEHKKRSEGEGENNNGFELNEKEDSKPGVEAESAQSSAPEVKQKPKVSAAEYLMAFSAIRNGRQIFNLRSQSEGALGCIHGLRVLSLTWVILVHTYLQLFAIGGNKMVRVVTERSFMFRTIGNATFSVDTFFFISGVLVTYLYNTAAPKKYNFTKTVKEFGSLVAYRFLRLSPIYMFVVGLVQTSMAYIRNNSVFEPNIRDDGNCDIYWWRNLLYINNFYSRAEMCMLWSWYLAADTQFFILSAIILIIGKRRFKLAVGTLAAILIGAWSTTAFVAYTNSYEAKLSEPFGLFDELYDKPWTRIGPYIVGMVAGHLIKNNEKGFVISKVVVVIGWTVSGGVLLSLVYGLGSGLSVALSTVYVSLGHTAWGLCLAWILVACHTGYGGVINSILANPVFFPLSRLTFCAYLVHPVIMVLTTYVMDGSFHIHNGIVVIIFLGNTVASFFLSFILSLGFESPVVRLIKLVFK